MRHGQQRDAVIIGGGHNGLVAAAYLARAGLDVVVLEQRDVVGGLCTTEELFPGHRGNAVANSPHNVDPVVLLELELASHGLRFIHPEPSALMAFPEKRAYVSYVEPDRRRSEIAKFSPADVDGFAALNDLVSGLANSLQASYYAPPPAFRDLVSGLSTPQEEDAFARVLFGSMSDLFDQFLESPEMKSSMAIMAILTNNAGPRSAGSAMPLMLRALHHRSTQQVQLPPRLRRAVDDLGPNRWIPFGGMGAITQAMASAARQAGADIRTEAGVARIIVEDGAARGVALTSGEEVRSRIVLANINPRVAMLHLVGEEHLDRDFVDAIERIPTKGTTAKVYLQLDGLPQFDCASDADENAAFARCNFRVAPDIEGIQRDFEAAQLGRFPEHPMIMGQLPSALDPSLTPPGKHVMSLSVFYAPYELEGGRSWDVAGDDYARLTIATLRRYISNIDDILVDHRVLTPLDLERRYALPGGQPSHGDLVPGGYFGFRPVPGWSDYRTPIVGLYLCGVGTWPGNFVSGLAGRNATVEALSDLRDLAAAASRIEARRSRGIEHAAAVAPV